MKIFNQMIFLLTGRTGGAEPLSWIHHQFVSHHGWTPFCKPSRMDGFLTDKSQLSINNYQLTINNEREKGDSQEPLPKSYCVGGRLLYVI